MDLLNEDFNQLIMGFGIKDLEAIYKKCRFHQENLLQSKNGVEQLKQTFAQRKYCHPNSPKINKLIEAIPR